MSKPLILHFATPLENVSPFDINMAFDAGFQVASYTHLALKDIKGLTQDAMFSRAPQDAAKTCLFIGGRDALLALDMMKEAKEAMFPPFQISVFADPNGAFTTAGAMIACVERQLKKLGAKLAGARVAVIGATGVVGGVVGIIAAEEGAEVVLVAHDKSGRAEEKAAAFEKRFKRRFQVSDGSTEAGKRAAISDATIILACGRAGVQALSRADLGFAKQLKVVADVNAVPPLGVEGVAVDADGAPIEGSQGVGIGALAIGNIKFKAEHELFKRIDGGRPQTFDYRDAHKVARELVGG
jgi:methylene-tetrahydromethanopterin dehydrogenase